MEFSGPKIKHVSFALQGGFLSPELPGDPVMRSFKIYCVSVQLLSCVQLFATPCTTAHQTSLSITNSKSLIKLMSIQSVMPSNHLILCHPLLFLPSIFPIIRVFSNESVLRIRWPKYWSFSFSISPSDGYIFSFSPLPLASQSLQMVTAAMKLKDAYTLEGKLVMTNLDSILKSRDITLPTKVCLVKAMVFPVVMNGCESWTIKKAEH